jgi:hypothetical protein
MTQHNPTQPLLLPSLRLQLHGGIGVAMGFLLIYNQRVCPFSKGKIGVSLLWFRLIQNSR